MLSCIVFSYSRLINGYNNECKTDFEKVINDEYLVLSIWNELKPLFAQEVKLFAIHKEEMSLVYFSTLGSRQDHKIILNLPLNNLESLNGFDESVIVKYKIGGDIDNCKESLKFGSQVDCDIFEVKINGDKKNMIINYDQENKMMRASYECFNRVSKVTSHYEFKIQ